ncbi:MAG: hypothetical protein KatS3mg057_0101 [Herpetosiphonaceae bacterium]|nr:MAG: hypothetical protein KatS3mg057_0101 [Herpetosiphonaceae bacterium]
MTERERAPVERDATGQMGLPGQDMPLHQDTSRPSTPPIRSALISGAFLGVGLMGAVDEIAFHQLLQWHNFYIHTTPFWRIFSDGLFHIFTALMLVAGALRLWSQRQWLSQVSTSRPLWAGLLLGAGGFQLFDGTVNHKLLQIHPVREGVENPLPYDIAWITSAIVLLAAGWLLWRGRVKDAGDKLEAKDRRR